MSYAVAVVVELSTYACDKQCGEPSRPRYELSADYLQEIDDANEHFHCTSNSFFHVHHVSDFWSTGPGMSIRVHLALTSLPTVINIPVLRDLSKDLHTSHNVFEIVLRTDLVDNDSREDDILIHPGVPSYVGGRRGTAAKCLASCSCTSRTRPRRTSSRHSAPALPSHDSHHNKDLALTRPTRPAQSSSGTTRTSSSRTRGAFTDFLHCRAPQTSRSLQRRNPRRSTRCTS
jgi:hypothetical protein